jgi:hypothetical protein
MNRTFKPGIYLSLISILAQGYWLVCTACAQNAASTPGRQTSIELARDGKSGYSIVLSANASASEKRGAMEIQSHLKSMCGATLPIVTDADPLPVHAILVGRSRHTDALDIHVPMQELGSEGFILKTAGQHIAIAGSPVRGTMYGCTSFLETLGVRWLTPRVTVIPRKATVMVPTLDEEQSPAFEYREPYFTEVFDKDWAARLKTNGNAARLDESTGGKVRYHPFAHSFEEMIPPTLYPAHPEYFPLIKGTRTNGYVQRCLSNPEVLKLAIERVETWIKDDPGAAIYSVTQNDTANWCECEQCQAITKKYGTHSGLYLWFVNQIAEAVEKDHPEKLIDTFAYQFTEKPPTGIVPRGNVRVRLCPIAVCEAHPYEKCGARPTVFFMKNLLGWSQITKTLYIWHYNTNFANYLLPFPDFNQFPDSIRLYHRLGVKGIFFEGAYGGGGGGSDAEMRSYVMAKLLWNPSLDSEALVTEWMQGVYGPASKPMRQWFDLLHEKVRDPQQHFFIYDRPTVYYLSADVLAKGDELFDEATRLAAGNAEALEHLAKARLWLRYTRLAQKPTEGPELRGFLEDVRRFGITQISEGQSVDAWEKRYLDAAQKRK